jgi:hypothetical protein
LRTLQEKCDGLVERDYQEAAEDDMVNRAESVVDRVERKVTKYFAKKGEKVYEVAQGVAQTISKTLTPYVGDFSFSIEETCPADAIDMRPDSMKLQELKHLDAKYARVKVSVQVSDAPIMYQDEVMLVSLEMLSQVMTPDVLLAEVEAPEMYSRLLHKARTTYGVNINRLIAIQTGVDVVENTCRLAFALWSAKEKNIVKDFRMKTAKGSLLSRLATGMLRSH